MVLISTLQATNLSLEETRLIVEYLLAAEPQGHGVRGSDAMHDAVAAHIEALRQSERVLRDLLDRRDGRPDGARIRPAPVSALPASLESRG